MKIADTRRNNLRALAEIHGAAKLSVKLGYRQPSFLSQMIGPNPSREVSEKSARQYEQLLDLPEGYLDKPLFPDSKKTPKGPTNIAQAAIESIASSVTTAAPVADVQATSVALIAETIREVNRILQMEKISITVDQFSKLLSIEVLDAAEHGNKVRESHVKQMLEMIK